jgi:TPR repeat protein
MDGGGERGFAPAQTSPGRRVLTAKRIGLCGMAVAAVLFATALARYSGPGGELSPAEFSARGDAALDQKDYAAAMQWYRKAADQGYASASARIGGLYESGNGVAADAARAREWMTKAADAGDPFARSWIASRSSAAPRCDVANPPVACLFTARK